MHSNMNSSLIDTMKGLKLEDFREEEEEDETHEEEEEEGPEEDEEEGDGEEEDEEEVEEYSEEDEEYEEDEEDKEEDKDMKNSKLQHKMKIKMHDEVKSECNDNKFQSVRYVTNSSLKRAISSYAYDIKPLSNQLVCEAYL